MFASLTLVIVKLWVVQLVQLALTQPLVPRYSTLLTRLLLLLHPFYFFKPTFCPLPFQNLFFPVIFVQSCHFPFHLFHMLLFFFFMFFVLLGNFFFSFINNLAFIVCQNLASRNIFRLKINSKFTICKRILSSNFPFIIFVKNRSLICSKSDSLTFKCKAIICFSFWCCWQLSCLEFY